MDLNKVSIIIPTYQRHDFLRETLGSVKKQTYQNWECIVIDDDEKESAHEVLKEFMMEDNRFAYYPRPKELAKGVSSCRNYGFKQSRGYYIQWLDDDDLLSANKLEKQVEFLNIYRNEDIYVTCDWDYFWADKNYIPIRLLDSKSITPDEFFPLLRKKLSFIPLHCYMTPRNLAIKAGQWNNELLINEDAEYFTRILIESKRLYHVEYCYVLYRTHGLERISNRVNANAIESLINSLELIYHSLKRKNIRSDAYFKWKLLKLVLNNWQQHKNIFKRHSEFLKQIGIDLRYIVYFKLRFIIYKQVMPTLKKIRKI